MDGLCTLSSTVQCFCCCWCCVRVALMTYKSMDNCECNLHGDFTLNIFFFSSCANVKLQIMVLPPLKSNGWYGNKLGLTNHTTFLLASKAKWENPIFLGLEEELPFFWDHNASFIQCDFVQVISHCITPLMEFIVGQDPRTGTFPKQWPVAKHFASLSPNFGKVLAMGPYFGNSSSPTSPNPTQPLGPCLA